MSAVKIINCEKFCKADLRLFIESLEEITRLEQVKKVQANKRRAMFLIETMRYLSQPFSACCSSTLCSADQPEEESVAGHLEQKPLIWESAGFHQNLCITGDTALSSRNIYYYSLPSNCLPTSELPKSIDERVTNTKREQKVVYEECVRKKSKLSLCAWGRIYDFCKQYFGKKVKKSVKRYPWNRIWRA